MPLSAAAPAVALCSTMGPSYLSGLTRTSIEPPCAVTGATCRPLIPDPIDAVIAPNGRTAHALRVPHPAQLLDDRFHQCDRAAAHGQLSGPGEHLQLVGVLSRRRPGGSEQRP